MKNMLVSLANIPTAPDGQHKCRSFMNNKKRSRPRTEPCGTPHKIFCVEDLCSFICTNYFLLER